MCQTVAKNMLEVVPKTAVTLIKQFEGLSLFPYLDSSGYPTVGYGHLVKRRRGLAALAQANAIYPNEITQEEADKLLIEDIKTIALKPLTTSKLDLSRFNENQLAALCSLIFNIGFAAFKKSRCFKAFKTDDFPLALREWAGFVYSDGKKVPGLVNRRNKEIQIFQGE